MPNIPGIIGYVRPGSYSLAKSKAGSVSLPGGPTVVCIMGKGQREEILAAQAIGGEKDGEPTGFVPGSSPDGRHFKVSISPAVLGSIELYLNPIGDGTDLPLIQIGDLSTLPIDGYGIANANEDGMLWSDEFGDTDSSEYFGLNRDGYGDSVDGSAGESGDGVGAPGSFWGSKYARRYSKYAERFGFVGGAGDDGKPEPQHYVFDEQSGQIVLDQPLQAFDVLVASYVAESDINDPELFFDVEEIYAKHGYPSIDNTLALGVSLAYENGAGTILAVDSGRELQVIGGKQRLLTDPDFSGAFEQLEKYDCDIIVPLQRSRVYNEIAMPFYQEASYSTLTGDGTYLQEDPAAGNQPGINISPIATIPIVQPDAGDPVFIEVFLNGRELERSIDYGVYVSNFNGNVNTAIIFDPALSGGPTTGINVAARATLSKAPGMLEGDRVVVSYLPDPNVQNLIAGVQAAAMAHCEIMSNVRNRRERQFFTGSYEFADFDFLLDAITGVEANFGSTFRAAFYHPGGTYINKVIAGENFRIDSQYIGAAAAGFEASKPTLPTSQTNKILVGFSIPREFVLSNDEISLLGGAGIALVSPVGSGGKVMQGLTTINSGNAVEEEISVVRIRDFVAKTTRSLLEARFVGKVLSPGILEDIRDTTNGILDSLKSQGIITDFANVDVGIDPIDPRQANVKFDIAPVFPLNWIFIEFSVGVI